MSRAPRVGDALRALVSRAPRWPALVALVLTLCSAAFVRGETVYAFNPSPTAEVSIKAAMPTAQPPRFGFAPVRLTIENSAASERTWQFQFHAGVRGLYPGTAQFERSVTVPAGQTRDVWVYVPIAEGGTPGAPPVLSTSPSVASFGSRTATTSPVVTISRVANGMKVERAWKTASLGQIYRREETIIDETTGEMTTLTPSLGTTGSVTTRTVRPPAGSDVTYTIDPSSGVISSSYAPLSGPKPVIKIVTAGTSTSTGPTFNNLSGVTSPSPALAGALSPALQPHSIKLDPLANGLRVARSYGSGPSAYTEVREIDGLTGIITTTITNVSGTVSTRVSATPRDGSDVTYTVNVNDGSIGTNTKVNPGSTAAPKITIVQSTTTARPATAPVSTTGRPSAVRRPSVISSGSGGPPLMLYVQASGPGLGGGGTVSFSALGGTANMRPIAATASIERVLRETLIREGIPTPNLAPVDPATLPADWRVWSGFAYLYLPLDDFTALDAARRAALRGWVALGGELILVPPDSGPKSEERIGAGVIRILPRALSSAPSVEEWNDLALSLGGTTGHPDSESLMVKSASLLGTAVAEKEPDTSWLTIFLLLFAAVVGPVNLFVFAPAGRRHRLFFTTPIISLVAAVALAVTIFIQDGTGGTGLRRALVVLIPGDNQAAVFQEQASRTGFIASPKFPLASDTQLSVIPLEEMSQGRIGNFTSGPTLFRSDSEGWGSWFGSRGRQAVLLQRLVPTRGRIERVGTGAGGAPVVQSSLATSLRDFVLADERGNLWTTRTLVPGQRTELERGGTWIGTFPLGGTARFSQVLSVSSSKEAGRWGGKGDAGDLAPLASHASIVWQKSDVIYTGLLEGGSVEGGAKR